MSERQPVVAILAGGLGTRLRPVVPNKPKVLAEVRGRPFLSYLLDLLIEQGIQEVVLCTGHLGDQLRSTYGERYRSVRVRYSHEQRRMGTAGALRLALPLLDSEPILVLNGDSICKVDLLSLVERHLNCRAKVTVLLTRIDDTTRYGRVGVDGEGWIVSFAEKFCGQGPGWVNAGVYVVGHSVLLSIPEKSPCSLETEVFPGLAGKGLAGYQTNEPLLDIGTPECYANAQERWKATLASSVQDDPRRPPHRHVKLPFS